MPHVRSLFTAALLALVFSAGGCNSALYIPDVSGKGLSVAEVTKILDQAEAAAGKQPSLVRVDAKGKQQMTRMHIFVLDTCGQVIGRRSMADAWYGSISIAHAKAYTAMSFSSGENALTSRTIGVLSQPGAPLWQIGNSNSNPGLIEFPGGLPLYKNGKLVGGIGVSGDGVDEDEAVAKGGAEGFGPPKAIRVDTISDGKIPYTK